MNFKVRHLLLATALSLATALPVTQVMAATTAVEQSNAIVVRYQQPIVQVHPTQAALGKLQIAYKLSEYIESDNKSLTKDFFKDYNDQNGYVEGHYLLKGKDKEQKNKDVWKSGNIADELQGLVDTQACGTEQDKKHCFKPALEVVIGPNGGYYAIDGHHGANGILMTKALSGQGYDKANLYVKADYSQYSPEAFWKKMGDEHYLYAKVFNSQTNQYQNTTAKELPDQMRYADFVNDPFRSLNYFWRKSAIAKNETAVPFAEFYLGEFLVATQQFKDINFASHDPKQLDIAYQQAFDRGNAVLQRLIEGDAQLQALFKKTVTDVYGFSSKQLGLKDSFDADEVKKQRKKLEQALTFYNAHPQLQEAKILAAAH